ncbi:MAG TPA: type I-U CRISPR-associated RAMP protein Csb1/Cas7u [Candidatus Acidoferrales bacterium]|nr:type I-U CRISPR-associated RAMP protein Csb1/Cas7u [Candidatus Acidoferrales bacterium]
MAGAIDAPRILIEAHMKPLQGSRFQPTGFPSLGAAEFRGPDGRNNIVVESAQSVANRLEAAAWDDAANDLVEVLRGLPYVATVVGERPTDSIREAHRINSPYLFGGIEETLRERAGVAGKKKKGTDGEAESSGVDIPKLAAAVFFLDPNSVLHGVFLEKLVGSARLTRIVSGFIEAKDTNPAESGGVKNDRVDPVGQKYGGAVKGFGNVPFARTEYTADSITAYFNIDTSLLRSYRLGRDAEQLLVSLALWKIQNFLQFGGRLRTACDLEATEVLVKRPSSLGALPSIAELEDYIRGAIARCAAAGLFANPPKTEVMFAQK